MTMPPPQQALDYASTPQPQARPSRMRLTQGQLSMLLILYRDFIRQRLRKEAKDTLKSQMESKQMSKLLAMFL
jgi:hypothetical protein